MNDLPATDKHEFALYCSNLSSLVTKDQVIITDADLMHRIATVLRLMAGDSIVLFDQSVHAYVSIAHIAKKKSIACIVIKKEVNTILAPAITFLLPLLKREALETALYSLAEIGANTIQLITTDKSQKKWSDKEHERAYKIIIAAAEQSKNFAFPAVLKPISLSDYCQMPTEKVLKIMLDPTGNPLCVLLSEKMHGFNELVVIAGPEGGFTQEEKVLLQKSGYLNAALTPTVLRASQAAAVATAVIRTCLSDRQ